MTRKRIFFALLNMVVSTLGTAAPTTYGSRMDVQMSRDRIDITSQYPQIKEAVQSHFIADDVQLIQGTSPSSLAAAHYKEDGPLVAVVLGEDEIFFYLYLETCDICTVLARATKIHPRIEIVRQDHSLSCSELKQEILRFQIKSSVCDPTNS